MKTLFKVLATLLLLNSINGFSQGESWPWMFSYLNAGCKFVGGGAPVPVSGSQCNVLEGVASIGDPAGNLLFYTDGQRVWNKNNVQMPNGFGLMGNGSSTQSAVIVRRPGSTTIYYVFTCDAFAGAGGVRYTTVDMTLNGGLGDVVAATKNTLLTVPTTERVVAVRHCNNVDVWVVTQKWQSNQYLSYLVTSAGVNAVPVVSGVGAVLNVSPDFIGYMKASPNGKKLAYVSYGTTFLQTTDFNAATGVVSNPMIINNAGFSGGYGLEFSPDGSKLYISTWGSKRLYQLDLCAGSQAQVAASTSLIFTSASNLGDIQIGPDKKLYVARGQAPWAGVINSPNTLGAGCNYVDNGFNYGGPNGALGFPNFINDYLKLPPPPFTSTMVCLNGSFTSPTVITNGNCSSASNAITSYLWNFGDPPSGAANTSNLANPTHVFSAPGTYTVKLILGYACGADTLTGTVTAVGCIPTVTITGKSICQGTCAVITATPQGGTPPYTYAWTPNLGATAGPFTVCPNATTVYTLTITDANNKTATDTAVVVVNPSVSITMSVTNISCFGLANGSATANVTGGTPSFTFSWSNNGSTTGICGGFPIGNQTVTVIDGKGCTATQTLNITQPTLLTATVSTQNVLCNGALTGSASVACGGGTPPYAYSWSNSSSSASLTSIGAGNYNVTVMDANGCTVNLPAVITQPTALSLTINSSTTNICAGGVINVNGVVGGGTMPYSYTWSPGPNSSSYNISETVAGNYNYGLSVLDANGCPITGNIALTFNVIPIISATSGTICYGDKGVLVANGAEKYSWSPVNYSGSTYTVNGTNNLYVTVVGTNTSTGCSSLPVTATLIVNPLPVPVISASNNKGCVPLCMTFTSSNSGGDIASCSWDFGDGAFASNVINTDRCYNMAGDYTVRATVTDNNGCVSSVTYSVNAYPIPTADFNYSPLKPIENDEVTFTDASHEAVIKKWDWYFMNLPKPHSNSQNPTFMYSEAGTYAIALLVTSDHGCVDTIVKTIIVGQDYGIYVPNVFSPNGDGLNDVFQPKGFGITKYELRIFNRWGEELMMTNDFGHGWDGMYKGKLSKEDTYIWKINLTNVFGKSHELSGNVTLIK